jgi:hypothetical protein
MLVPTPGLSDFLVYEDTPQAWEPPHEGDRIDAETRDAICRAVARYLRSLGRVVEFVRSSPSQGD